MSESTFSIPASPRLDHKSLQTYVGHRDERKIGTAIKVQKTECGFDFRIHFTLFAVIMVNEVQFLYHRGMTDEQLAWMAKLANDNGVPPGSKLLGAYPAVPLERNPREP